ncbi:DUF6710 family protein [Carnobacterium maltaromaticum]|uniref:DUF6710 family protein n=1 Tax=Carnobacterium maltaromaticum TaxID=2751 RepID=UPI0012F8B1F4|nr:DUF6710 family protein [Carnobacterium maltaromaticum]
MFFRKKIKEEIKEEIKDNKRKEIFTNFITHAEEIIKKPSNEEVHPIYIFLKQITDHLTFEGALSSYRDVNANIPFEIASIFEGSNFHFQKELITRILTEKPHIEDMDIYRQHHFKLFEFIFNRKFNNSPIVLNPWDKDRITDAITKIAIEENIFNSEKFKHNVENTYYYPLGILVCTNGNHSQYSAKLKGQGQTHIREIVDISNLFEYMEFDGEYNYCKSTSEEGLTEIVKFPLNTDTEFYAGVIFEIGRLLNENIKIIPTDIYNCIKNAKSI